MLCVSNMRRHIINFITHIKTLLNMKYLLILTVLFASCTTSWHVDARRPIQDYEYRVVVYGDSCTKYDIYDAYGNLIANQIFSNQLDSVINDDNL